MIYIKKFYDTNALLDLGEEVFKESFVLSQVTLREIENIKTSSRKDEETKYKARIIAKALLRNRDKYIVVRYSESDRKKVLDIDSEDTRIIADAAIYKETEEVVLVTNDINMTNIALNETSLKVQPTVEGRVLADYYGYKKVKDTDKKLAKMYQDSTKNVFRLKTNEFLLVEDSEGNVVDKKYWTGREYKNAGYSIIQNKMFGKVKPINPPQELAFSMLQNAKIKVKAITGTYGTGKDFVMIVNALTLIQKGLFDKLIWIRNAVEVKDAPKIGYLKGDMEEKLKPYAMLIADHVGGEEVLDELLDKEIIQIQNLGFVKGRSYERCIVYISEAEDMTKEHIKLLVSRIGKNSELWINGDYAQNDSDYTRGHNGLVSLIKSLTGNELFAHVKFDNIERSVTAKLADLIK